MDFCSLLVSSLSELFVLRCNTSTTFDSGVAPNVHLSVGAIRSVKSDRTRPIRWLAKQSDQTGRKVPIESVAVRQIDRSTMNQVQLTATGTRRLSLRSVSSASEVDTHRQSCPFWQGEGYPKSVGGAEKVEISTRAQVRPRKGASLIRRRCFESIRARAFGGWSSLPPTRVDQSGP
jgi:hypothetical protein